MGAKNSDLYYFQPLVGWMLPPCRANVSRALKPKLSYLYSAGTKFRKQPYENNSIIKTVDYQGDFQYENGVLQFIAQPEGYIYKDATGYRYVYQYKDHLGNNRLSFMRNAGTVAIVKESNYYPFGLTHKGYNNITTSLGSAGAKKYQYNGKELQTDFGLDWYDYGARFYDPSLGRWFVADPLAEKYYSNSPYHFSGNNPILFLDLDGMDHDGWQFNIETNKLKRINDLGGKGIQFVTITNNDNVVLGNANVDGAKVYVDKYEINSSESVVSVSNSPTDAKSSALKNVGQLISNDSPLSNDAKKSLMKSSVSQAGNDFLATSVSVVGDALGKVGTGVTVAGYGAIMFPGGQLVGGGLIGIGESMISISSVIDIGTNLKNGNYGKAAFGMATLATGSLIRNKINMLQSSSKFGDQGATILKTGVSLKLQLLNTAVNKTIEKRKQQ